MTEAGCMPASPRHWGSEEERFSSVGMFLAALNPGVV